MAAHRACWRCVLVAGLCCGVLAGCGDHARNDRIGVVAERALATPAQDWFPDDARGAVDISTPPFATAAREVVVMRESITRDGEPLAVGSIEVPKGWRIVEQEHALHVPCEWWKQCVLWQAVSPDGTSQIALLSPRRGFETPGGGLGSPQAEMAAYWLRGADAGSDVAEAVAGPVAVDAAMPATRKGWSAGGAWLSLARDSLAMRMRELRAVDVESRQEARGLHQVQSWPVLVLRMPEAEYDADAADAVRRSLRFDPEWVPQWWLAWEVRTIRDQCTLGYRRGDCHVQDGPYIDYFRSGRSLGLWDIRSIHPYGYPDEQRYDAGAASAKR